MEDGIDISRVPPDIDRTPRFPEPSFCDRKELCKRLTSW